ncbi:hypothetical protein V5J35_000838 [Endozoicomonas sp. NE40]|uniref:Uncharacterized protein n=1 Tax=Endozoicomonas lisbonensis TaxID=3120522 RepID=A0ABV2SD07_9GAMM
MKWQQLLIFRNERHRSLGTANAWFSRRRRRSGGGAKPRNELEPFVKWLTLLLDSELDSLSKHSQQSLPIYENFPISDIVLGTQQVEKAKPP